jgi:hypothetical protein
MFSLLEAAPPTAPKPVRDGARKLQGLVGLACCGLRHREAVEREVGPSRSVIERASFRVFFKLSALACASAWYSTPNRGRARP